MTTALEVINRAFEIIQVKPVGDTLSADDADLGLRAFKGMLEEWGIEPNTILGLTELTFTPAAGTQSVTIGTGGDIVTTMPTRIDESSFVRISSVDYPIYFASTFDEYTEKSNKGLQGFQCACYWMRVNSGLGRLYLYPASNGGELHLWVAQEVIASYESMTTGTTIVIPRGYTMPLYYGLAELLLMDYDAKPDLAKSVRKQSASSMRQLKRLNARVPQLNTNVLQNTNTSYDAVSDRHY